MHYIINEETGEIYLKFVTKNMRALKLIAKRMQAVVRQKGKK